MDSLRAVIFPLEELSAVTLILMVDTILYRILSCFLESSLIF